IVFSRPSDEGTSIWQVRLDPSAGSIAGRSERLTANVDVQPAIGPGGRLVFARLNESMNIWALPLDPVRGLPTGGLRRLTDGQVVDGAPSITGDGKKMAFIS